MDFTDKRVMVTGSSRGIGFAIARAFVGGGARVAINGRTKESVSAAIERLGNAEHLVAMPDEISHAVLYLAAYEARFITGAALPIDAGASAGH